MYPTPSTPIILWTADARTRQADSAKRAAAARLMRLHEDAIDMAYAAGFDGVMEAATWWLWRSQVILAELERL